MRGKTTRFIFYNTEYFEGLEGKKWKYVEVWKRIFGTKKNLLRICREIFLHNPDVVAFVEVQKRSFFGREIYCGIAKRRLGMKYFLVKPKYLFKGITAIFRYIPLLKEQSNVIFSKKKLHDSKFIYFDEGVKKLIIKTSIMNPKKITFFIVHLALREETRHKQLSELSEIIKKIKTPVVLAGDFNNFGGGRELDILVKNTRLRKIKESFTFPAFHPSKVIDHILISPEIRVKKYEVLKMKLSDHLPIMVDFEIR